MSPASRWLNGGSEGYLEFEKPMLGCAEIVALEQKRSKPARLLGRLKESGPVWRA